VRGFLGFQRGARQAPGRRRVLFFGTYDAAIYPRIAVLREGFASLGDEVVECNEPLRVPTGLRVRMLREPWLAPVLLWQILRCWLRLALRAWSAGHIDLIVVGYMGQFDIHLARALWPRVPIVLDHLVPAGEAAVDRRCSNVLLVGALRLLDRAATRAADVVCVDTEQHLALAGRRRGVVVPVGARESWFVAPRHTSSAPLKVIFFGSFTPLQGAPVIAEAIALLGGSGIEFTLVGRGQDWAECRALAAGCPNVRWLDWVEPDELPAFVAGHDVTLGIFGTGNKARLVVPTKVFQGAAAGTAIVTSDTEPQRAALGGAAAYVRPGDADALARTLLALEGDRDRVRRLRDAAFAIADARFRPAEVVAPFRLPASRARGPLASGGPVSRGRECFPSPATPFQAVRARPTAGSRGSRSRTRGRRSLRAGSES
jgi:glycosyltransferase involved in cell wall biosynthesis